MSYKQSNSLRERIAATLFRGRWSKVLTVLAGIVVFCTTYALILPAITMSSQDANCGFEEHEHAAECYDAEGGLICGLEEHIHTLACYADLHADIENEDVWRSEIPDLTGDRNADAVAVASSLIGYRESDRNFLVSSDDQTKGYTRFGHWYGQMADQVLRDTADEVKGEIVKDIDREIAEDTTGAAVQLFYEELDTFAAQNEERKAAAEAEGSEYTAVEEPADIMTGIADYASGNITPERAHEIVNYIGLLRADEVAARIPGKIAEKMIGILPTDVTEGQSAKIDNGLPAYSYMDWNAMFVSYVLHYAQINEYGAETDAGNWAGALAASGKYIDAAGYIPTEGDLIFYTPNAGADIQVGIVSQVNKSFFGLGRKVKSISVITGDMDNSVREIKVAVEDYSDGDVLFETIHGYVQLDPGKEPAQDVSKVDSIVDFFLGSNDADVPNDEAVADEAEIEAVADETQVAEDAAQETVEENDSISAPDASVAEGVIPEDESIAETVDAQQPGADITVPADESTADQAEAALQQQDASSVEQVGNEPVLSDESVSADLSASEKPDQEIGNNEVLPGDETDKNVKQESEEQVPGSIADETDHIIGATAEDLEETETRDLTGEPDYVGTDVQIVQTEITEDETALIMYWQVAAQLPGQTIPEGAVLRVDTGTGKQHAMTAAQAKEWAGNARVSGENVSFAESASYKLTFIGSNGLLYSWNDVQAMGDDAITTFTGFHVQLLEDVNIEAGDGYIAFGYPTTAYLSDANIGRNYYVTKASVDGYEGTASYVYENGEAVQMDQNKVLQDAGLDAEPDVTKTLTAGGNGYTVTMTYGLDAGIPDVAKLKVTEIRQGTPEYDNYISEAKKALGIDKDETLDLEGRFFDIKIMTKEGEFTPDASVRVDIQYDETIADIAKEDVSAIHFAENGAEEVSTEAEIVNGEMAGAGFEAESFSVYGIVYRVDSIYDGFSYLLHPDTTTELEEIFVKLGICKEAPEQDESAEEAADDQSGTANEEPKMVSAEDIDEESPKRGAVDQTFAEFSENIKNVESDNDSVSVSKKNGWSITADAEFEGALLTVTIADGKKYCIDLTRTGEYGIITAAAGGYSITVDLGDSLPEGNYRVDAVQNEATEEQKREIEYALTEELDDGTTKIARVFDAAVLDISIVDLDKKEEVEPDGKVWVTIEKEGEEIPSIIHFKDDGTTELLEVEDNSFVTESFSAFATEYTVDFTYAGIFYSIGDDHRILLSKLLRILDIDVDVADVRDVEMELSEQIDDDVLDSEFYIEKQADGDWLLKSDTAFNNVYRMTIVTNDGTEYIIIVTDATYTGGNEFISGGSIKINGRTQGIGPAPWVVYPDTDYELKLSFEERGTKQFPKGGDTIVVNLPNGLTLKEGETGTFDIPAGLAGTIRNNVYVVRNGKLYITFGPDPNDILTRSSKTRFDIRLTAQFSENADQLNFNDRVKQNVDIDNNSDVDINKTGSYNASTGKMEYTLTIKSKGKTKNIRVSDAIQGNIISFDQGSVTINPNKTLTQPVTPSGNGFELTIGEMSNNETVTINYTADVDISNLYPNYTLGAGNGNTLKVKPEGGDEKTKDFNYNNKINFSNISKSSTGSSTVDDGETKVTTIDWKLVVNDHPQASIVGGKITDTIDWNSKDIMKYSKDGNTVPLTVVVKDQNGNIVTTLNNEHAELQSSYPGAPESWKYTIPTVGSADPKDQKYTYEITYSTVATNTGDNSVTVGNGSSNDHGGSSSGTGVAPGVGPGGGGGGSQDVEVTPGKSVKAVTDEYIDWDIVVNIPAHNSLLNVVVTDDLPWHYADSGSGVDNAMVDKFVPIPASEGGDVNGIIITGLDTGTLTKYTVNKTESNDKYLRKNGSSVLREIVTVELQGIPASQTDSTVHITIRTQNDPEWIDATTKNKGFATHQNNAKVNNSNVSAEATLLKPSIEKKGNATSKPGWYQGETGDLYYSYEVTISGISSLPITLTDNFDEHMEFIFPSDIATDKQNYQEFYVSGGENAWSNTSSGSVNNSTYGPMIPSYSASGNTLTITLPDDASVANDSDKLVRDEDGSFFPYYHFKYYLRVPKAQADEIRALAIANKGSYSLGNTVALGDISDEYEIDFSVKAVDKDGWWHDQDEPGSNNRKYDFIIDLNPEQLDMAADEDTITMTDTHSSNISVDYTTIEAYDLTNKNVTMDQLKQAIKRQKSGGQLESWMVNPDEYRVAKENLESKGIDWDFSGSTGTFNIPDESHIVIFYSALVVGNNNQQISNEADLEGFKKTKTDNRYFSSDASGEADLCQIQLLKYVYGKTSVGLPGATFQLFMDDGSGNKIPMTYGDTEITRGEKSDAYLDTHGENVVGKPITFTTDDNGYTLIQLNQTSHGAELEEGIKYYLKEIASPDGYKIDSSVEFWEFTLTKDPDGVSYGERDANGVRQWIYFYFDDILKMSNTPMEDEENISIEVNKKWLDENGAAITDTTGKFAYIQLYRKSKTVYGDGREPEDTDYTPIKAVKNGNEWTITNGEDLIHLSGNTWNHSWDDLPRSRFTGSGSSKVTTYYTYDVREESLTENFVSSTVMTETSAQDGTVTDTYNITNQQKPSTDKIDIKVVKKWYEENGTTEITSSSAKWAELPETIDFILYRAVSLTPFAVRPSSGGNPYNVTGALPAGITLDSDVSTYTMTKDYYSNGVAFENLPVYEEINGTTYYYSYYIREIEQEGYIISSEMETLVDGNTGIDTVVQITMSNTEQPSEKKTDLTVKKVWKDADGKVLTPNYNTPAVTYQVYQVKSSKPFTSDPLSGGTLYDVKNSWGGYEWNWYHVSNGTYQIGKDGNWNEVTFTNLPLVTVDGGKPTYYAYYLKEINLPDNITGTSTIEKVTGETNKYSITLTNQEKPKETSIAATKVWTKNGEAIDWPDDIKVEVTLYSNGSPATRKVEVSEGVTQTQPVPVQYITEDTEDYTIIFDELPVTDENGNEIVYTVKEKVYKKTLIGGWEETDTVNGMGFIQTVTENGEGYTLGNDLQGPGKLVVKKSFNEETGETLTPAQKENITFTVTGQNGFSETKTYAEILALNTNGEWQIDNLASGDYLVRETNADVSSGTEEYSYARSTTFTVKAGDSEASVARLGTSASTVVSSGKTTEVAFVNKYEKVEVDKTSIELNKTWINVTGKETKFKLYRVETDAEGTSGGGTGTGGTELVNLPVVLRANGETITEKRVKVSLNDVITVTISNAVDGFPLRVGSYNQGGNYEVVNPTNPTTLSFKIAEIKLGKVTKVISDDQQHTLEWWDYSATQDPDYGKLLFIINSQNWSWDANNIQVTGGSTDIPPVYVPDDYNPQNGLTQTQVEAIEGATLIDREIVLNQSNDWKATIDELPITNPDGTKAYQYYVVEEGGATYNATYSHQDASITVSNHQPTETQLTLQKTWLNRKKEQVEVTDSSLVLTFDIYQISSNEVSDWSDLDSQEGRDALISGKTPYKSDVTVKYEDVEDGVNWKKTIYNLPVSDGGSTTYKYIAVEKQVGNATDISVYNPTYSHVDGEIESSDAISNTAPDYINTKVTATKSWNDTFGWHPSITYVLYRKALEDGESDTATYKTADEAKAAGYKLVVEDADGFVNPLTIAAGTSTPDYTWDTIPLKDPNGKMYRYVVIENAVTDYHLDSVTEADGTYAFTNTPDTMELTIAKSWKENGAEITNTDTLSNLPAVQYKLYRVPYSDAARTTSSGTPTEITDISAYNANANGSLQYDSSDVDNAYGLSETLTGLPKYTIANDGTYTYYSYYVEEVGVIYGHLDANGTPYAVSYKVGDGPVITTASEETLNMGADSNQITISNATSSINIELMKADDNNDPIRGAKFRLEEWEWTDTQHVNGQWQTIDASDHYAPELEGLSDGIFTVDELNGESGKFLVTKLHDGIYRFIEVQAPDGYVIKNEIAVLFVIEQGVVTQNGENIVEYVPTENMFIVTNKKTELDFTKNWMVQSGVNLGNWEITYDIERKTEAASESEWAVVEGYQGLKLTGNGLDSETIKYEKLPVIDENGNTYMYRVKETEYKYWVEGDEHSPYTGTVATSANVTLSPTTGAGSLNITNSAIPETDFQFTKEWIGPDQSESNPAEWPTDKEILVTIGRKIIYQEPRTNQNGDPIIGENDEPEMETIVEVDEDFSLEYELTANSGSDTVPTSAENAPAALTFTKVIEDTNQYVFTLDGLPQYGSAYVRAANHEGEFEYFVSEATVQGYNEPIYFTYDEDNRTYERALDATSIGDQGKIQNRLIVYTLPSTGGYGTEGTFAVGFVLVVFAASGFIMKKRRKAA